jgi:hypothetical protein
MVSLKSIQTEVDASYLYKILAENEADENVSNVFHQMSDIEHSHAVAFLAKNNFCPFLKSRPVIPNTSVGYF